jgi:hypothetical protein
MGVSHHPLTLSTKRCFGIPFDANWYGMNRPVHTTTKDVISGLEKGGKGLGLALHIARDGDWGVSCFFFACI